MNKYELKENKILVSEGVAETIINQLGGSKFRAITGARDFVKGKEKGNDLVQFALPANFAKNGINKVKIVLTKKDLYDITFYKIRGTNVKVIATETGVYADMMGKIFTSVTGLDIRL